MSEAAIEEGLHEAMEDDDLIDVSLDDDEEGEPVENADDGEEENLTRGEKKKRRGVNRERELREEHERKSQEYQQQLQAEREARIRAEEQARAAQQFAQQRSQPGPDDDIVQLERALQPLWDKNARLQDEARRLQKNNQLTPSEYQRLNREMLSVQQEEARIRHQHAVPRQSPQPTAAQQMAQDEFPDVVGDRASFMAAAHEEQRLRAVAIRNGKLRQDQPIPLSMSRQALENTRREFGTGPAAPPPDVDRRKTHGTSGSSQAGSPSSNVVTLNGHERAIARERYKGLPDKEAYREMAKAKKRMMSKKKG